ncbi:MAG: Nuclear protein SET [Candidatus Collierbacteria bacterium GW2011_GWB1_44_6]|uniref:Nuclear protein SET n=2 Tax=Candidatus Collieribacteriota TaxID=1752725 RepID=A0A0G1JPS1_9BACT|nr:MAG: Nuclear protein SET [Candidatus Collierbacteria bacterium GW2011_GWC2_43_12]KKT73541.1 MAG: Nuclear protein SET [Candidatus Collierbacteria bacterium GW2011_GWB1_44_6]KKT82808.1 MAG: Nuclear protein SET [Microgenomates group bacterium GW2011_GWC1_44_9]
MIHIKYKLDKSKIHGVGLFTDEDLDQGQLVYTASPKLDVNLSEQEFEELNPKEQVEISYWGFWDKDKNVWHVDFDNSRFINHSDSPTVTQDIDRGEAYMVTTRKVDRGEEITQNYLEFESVDDLRKRGIEL